LAETRRGYASRYRPQKLRTTDVVERAPASLDTSTDFTGKYQSTIITNYGVKRKGCTALMTPPAQSKYTRPALIEHLGVPLRIAESQPASIEKLGLAFETERNESW
jgi:hypothetical protein